MPIPISDIQAELDGRNAGAPDSKLHVVSGNLDLLRRQRHFKAQFLTHAEQWHIKTLGLPPLRPLPLEENPHEHRR